MRISASLQSLVFIVVIVTGGYTQDRNDAKTFPTGPATTARIVIENEYQFSVRHYEPVVSLKPVARDRASYRTPEFATEALVSAMVTGDFDWFQSLWDSASLRMMEARDREFKHDTKFWIDNWEKTVKNRRVELTDRVDTGDYALISYRLVSSTDKEPAIEWISVFKFQDGRWFATQDLSSDPVQLYWKTPNTRRTRVVRGLNDADK